MSLTITSASILKKSIPCRIAAHYYGEGRKWQYFGRIAVGDSMEWAIVVWDDEEDPDFHKTQGLEIMREQWSKADDDAIEWLDNREI